MKLAIWFLATAVLGNHLLNAPRVLEYIEYQENKTHNIIFLHYSYGNAESFFSLARHPLIKAKFNSYLISLPNFGNSYEDPDFSRESMARDIKRFIESRNLKNVYLVGHSIGAVVAMTTAAKYGSLVKGVLSLDWLPFAIAEDKMSIIQALTDSIEKLDLTKSLAAIEAEFLAKVAPDPVLAKVFVSNLEQTNTGYRITGHLANYKKNLRSLAQPAIYNAAFYGKFKVIVGEKSPFYDPAKFSSLSTYYPKINVSKDVISLDGGHFAFLEFFDTTVQTLLTFIK